MSKILIDEATVKQVLEAMQRIQVADMDCDFLNIRQSDQLDKAITALREALAEQALDKMAENARELGLDYEPAQQEPVAWAMYQKGHLLSFWMDKGDAYDFEFTSEHSWRPLYTTPQPAQRKPLTDEEIYMHCPSWLSQEQCKTWVRQIEAAHNIKENT